MKNKTSQHQSKVTKMKEALEFDIKDLAESIEKYPDKTGVSTRKLEELKSQLKKYKNNE